MIVGGRLAAPLLGRIKQEGELPAIRDSDDERALSSRRAVNDVLSDVHHERYDLVEGPPRQARARKDERADSPIHQRPPLRWVARDALVHGHEEPAVLPDAFDNYIV